MHADNKRPIEKAKAQNEVEEYIYGMKDKLESVYKEFISEQDKEQFLRLLNDTDHEMKPGCMKKVTMKPRQFITRNLRSSRIMVTQYLRE